jgi:hypothetical protein
LNPLEASYCWNCAAAYPWTERRITVAKDLAIDLDMLTSAERDELAGLIDDVVRDTPGAPVAARRMKALMEKAGHQVPDVFKGVLVGAVARGVSNLMWSL